MQTEQILGLAPHGMQLQRRLIKMGCLPTFYLLSGEHLHGLSNIGGATPLGALIGASPGAKGVGMPRHPLGLVVSHFVGCGENR
ncbi:Uncharacterised protein [Mycobacteroides abscessus subsp. massiliense]|uniref:Uncharacterized protein n=1 Tax=Mycobacteroides abscessus subsp. massiliense TaxID=1962118 RepID=A0A1T8ZTI5_9MYCO|nr:hypothetical protein MMAS_27860 [Mycobacteroides abscessus subsp. massiliense CCUG 48898 = JCM 15300]MBE5403953.1 hypothetical protein [Mycobacteroides abscessus]SIN46730.1 Uncharacterised protein [Mycobacteroides abscessus subsp. bolletii]SKF10310.1 Uncharacterised protein [Mycobacteroides abscessus subsp. massiliense]MBE5431361.1 hypothetical protein [Mycobacteroides abscessus]